MRERVQGLIDGYESGMLSREDLIDQLSALAGGDVSEHASDSTFRGIGLNHVAFAVSDVGAMADFMGRHLGTSVIWSTEERGFLAAGANHFVGLFRKPETGLDHMCFSVADYDPDEAFARLSDLGMSPHQNEDRVFFRGPDGIMFQVADTWGDYPQRP